MRILYVTQGFPDTRLIGGQIATFYNILQLTRAGHAVTVATLVEPSSPTGPERISEIARVVALDGVLPNSFPSYAWNLLDPLPWPIRRYASREFARRTQDLIRSDQYDLILFNSLHSATTLPAVREATDRPCVLLAHNVQSTIMRLYARHQASVPRRLYATIQWRKMLSFESRACAGFDLVTALSDVDRRELEALAPGVDVRTIPLMLDIGSIAAESAEKEDFDILFVGYLGWAPNLDSLRWFLDTIFERVRKRRPGTALTIAGAAAPSWIEKKACASEDIRFLGQVDDIYGLFGRARVLVVPLRIGSGVRLKIVEAMAARCAVVSTSKGCEGLDLSPGEHLEIADTPEAFADAVVALLESPERRAALCERAQLRAYERHDALAPSTPLVEICEELGRSTGEEAS